MVACAVEAPSAVAALLAEMVALEAASVTSFVRMIYRGSASTASWPLQAGNHDAVPEDHVH